MNLTLPGETLATTRVPTLKDRIDQKLFGSLYSRSLVYNCCWEDPAVDRRAMQIGPEDRVLVITSAGCNALDYALERSSRVDAVDANPRQNALLELKIAGIRSLSFDEFFSLFGDGFHKDARKLYRFCLRQHLSDPARKFWDRHIDWFSSRYGSFYFHGLAGFVARGFQTYFRVRPQLARGIFDLLDARNIAEQRAIYDERIAGELWTPVVNWVLNRQMTMNFLGVPHTQRALIRKQQQGNVAAYVRESVEYVFRNLPVADNYFWRVYVTGRYTRGCCPNYLTEAGFTALKSGRVDSIHVHTGTVTDYLDAGDHKITHFVLLDHMDWMSDHQPDALAMEWDAILRRAAPGAQVLIRSAHAMPPFLDWLRIGPMALRFDDLFERQTELAACLHELDRVHTYAGFVIARLKSDRGPG